MLNEGPSPPPSFNNLKDNEDLAKPDEVFWPQDLLPRDRPDVRIPTFGYDTIVTRGWQPANKNNLFAHARAVWSSSRSTLAYVRLKNLSPTVRTYMSFQPLRTPKFSTVVR